jgi:Lipase (class 3)
MGHNPKTRIAFVSFRGSSDVEDWLADLDAIPDAYRPVSGFGQVHAGFQTSTNSSIRASPRTWPPQPPAAIRS